MKKIFLVIIAICNMNNILAQFQTAFNPPKYGNYSINVKMTNCDMLTGAAAPLTNIRISAIVCDGGTPALLSEAYNTTTNTIIQANSGNLFYSDAQFPDVCLVSRGSMVWALVLFKSLSHGVCLETFEWQNGSNVFLSLGVQILSTHLPFSDFVHIDSDRNDYWAATWDEVGSNTIHTCVGRTNSTGPYLVTNCNNGNVELDFPVNIASTATSLSAPDVAIYSNTGITPNVVFIHYTYLTDDQKVIVQTYSVSGNNFTAICDGNNGSLPAANVDVIENQTGSLNQYFTPRIATHRESNTSTIIQDGFVVIYNRIYKNINPAVEISEVAGRNYFCKATNGCYYTPALSTNANNYTNGSLNFWNISPAVSLPAINANFDKNILLTITLDRYTGTYSSAPTTDGNDVIIGWTRAVNNNFWPVMLYANVETGQPQAPPLFSPSMNKYWFNNVSTLMNTAEVSLSVASETGNIPDILYAWFDGSTNRIVYKHVASGYKMRMAGSSFQNTTSSFYNDIVQQGITLPDGISSTKLQMQLTDARGVILVKTTGDITLLDHSLRQMENSLGAGIYLLTIANDTELVYRSKLIKPE